MQFSKFEVRAPQLDAGQFTRVVEEMDRRLEVQREQFAFAALSTFKGEGIDLPGIPMVPEKGTALDSALRAFQLVCVVGFSWEYMGMSLWESFEKQLTNCLDNGHGRRIQEFRDSYLDCEGNWDCLTQALAQDIYMLWEHPEPRQQVLSGLVAGVGAFIVMNQSCAATAIGDEARARKLRQSIPFG